MKFYPYKKEGGGERLSHAEGGHKRLWGSFYSIMKGGCKRFLLFKRGGGQVLPCLEWGGGVSIV